jgi:hypothetical protein
MKPHGGYVQNFTSGKVAHERLAVAQQRELQRVCDSGISDLRFVSVTIKFQAVTGREQRDSLAAANLKSQRTRL